MQLGLNYTPVPLVTMKALHKIGAGGQSREQVELALSYRLGVPLVKQISPEYVAQAKSLRGSRYDPIERKNVPVLEFRQRKTLQVFRPRRRGACRREKPCRWCWKSRR